MKKPATKPLLVHAWMSLHDVLGALGYATRGVEFGKKAIVSATGEKLFTGTAGEVWTWLRKTGQIA